MSHSWRRTLAIVFMSALICQVGTAAPSEASKKLLLAKMKSLNSTQSEIEFSQSSAGRSSGGETFKARIYLHDQGLRVEGQGDSAFILVSDGRHFQVRSGAGAAIKRLKGFESVDLLRLLQFVRGQKLPAFADFSVEEKRSNKEAVFVLTPKVDANFKTLSLRFDSTQLQSAELVQHDKSQLKISFLQNSPLTAAQKAPSFYRLSRDLKP